MTRGPYQLLPPLSDEEYAALRDDIKSAGVRVPIDVDENGVILDGHHRKAIADELGVECPERVIRDLPEFAKVDYALSVNLARRHLTGEQKSKLVKASLKRDPRLSNREHARRCGVGHPFVASMRAVMEDAGQLDPESSRVTRGGGTYPSHRSAPLESDSNAKPAESSDRAPQVETVTTSPVAEAPAVVAEPGKATDSEVAGPDPRPATSDPAGQRTPDPDPEREKARMAARDRDAGRTWAARIVPDLQTAVATIAIAMKLGEPDLITADMVRQCREAVDLLEAIFKGEK